MFKSLQHLGLCVSGWLLCIISMGLTASFAYSFSNIDASITVMSVLSAGALIFMGFALDLSKYSLCRVGYKEGKPSYLVLGVLLVLFSLGASIAFFMTHDGSRQIEMEQYQHQMNFLNEEIQRLDEGVARLTTLFKQQSESRFHDQWEKATETQKSIQLLNSELSEKRKEKLNLQITQRDDGASSFFQAIASLLSVSNISSVKLFFYSVLALLIELVSIVVLSTINEGEEGGAEVPKSKGQGREPDYFSEPEPQMREIPPISLEEEPDPTVDEMDKVPMELEEEPEEIVDEVIRPSSDEAGLVHSPGLALLREKILSGEWPPTQRKLRTKEYKEQHELSENEVRFALQELEQEGLLSITSKGGYALTEKRLRAI